MNSCSDGHEALLLNHLRTLYVFRVEIQKMKTSIPSIMRKFRDMTSMCVSLYEIGIAVYLAQNTKWSFVHCKLFLCHSIMNQYNVFERDWDWDWDWDWDRDQDWDWDWDWDRDTETETIMNLTVPYHQLCQCQLTRNRNYPFNRGRFYRKWSRCSALLALCAENSPVNGEFPAQRPVTRSFDVFFDLRLNKQLSKQSWGWWFESPLCPLWRHL